MDGTTHPFMYLCISFTFTEHFLFAKNYGMAGGQCTMRNSGGNSDTPPKEIKGEHDSLFPSM
jgi:hypothetical protein